MTSHLLDLSTLDSKHAAKLLKARAWREANRASETARSRAWYEANREKVAARHRASRAANPEKIKAYQRAWCAAGPDSYLRRLFTHNLPIAPEAVPQEAIEIYRLTRLISRALKEQTT